MTYQNKTPAFRFLAIAIFGALAATTVTASAGEQNPADKVPGWISEARFNNMSDAEVCEIDRAQKLGSRVIIEGYTPSETGKIVDEALEDGTVTRASSTQATTSLQDRGTTNQLPGDAPLSR